MTAQAWASLPLELQQRPQWMLAGPNDKGELKVPLTVDPLGRVVGGDHSNPTVWLDFDYAVQCAQEFGYGIGYTLSPDDPFTCIDLDVKDQHNAPDKPHIWTTPEQFERYGAIINTMGCYTEVSGGGKGVHIWVRGKIGQGVKREGVELYSQQRFIVCTGNVIHNLPIQDRQVYLDAMVGQMRTAQGSADVLDEEAAEISDEELWRRASTADNATKFLALCEGDWAGLGYPSQSEADLSLMSMFTYYSRSNEQCRRLFRQTKLGERDKAQRDDRYLDYTLKLIRGRQAREEQAGEYARNAAMQLVAELEAQEAAKRAAQATPAQPPMPTPAPSAQPAPQQALQPPAPVDDGLPWPPGVTGALAGFIYGSAPRPVKEVAIVAALGFLAGVCGKAWCIPGSGLNLYIILIARSAIGKEAMHSGLSALVNRLREGVPTAGGFVDFSDFASGPALAKACAANSCFVNVAGEWGRKLKRLGVDSDRDGAMQQLRTLMTNLYQKSGPASIVGGISYSDKEKNVASVSGVAYSMIGETTPGTLYDSLTASMMEDGFLSRFTMIEYNGLRPPLNPNPNLVPDSGLTTYLQELCLQATTMLQDHRRCHVQRDAVAGQIMDAFNLECDSQINSTDDESRRQMWNRAHLKVCRIAALLAVADNWQNPVIQQSHAEWALEVVRRDIAMMQRRLDSGDVGQDDHSRQNKLLSLIREYLVSPPGPGYAISAAMQKEGIVPRKYLQLRTSRVSSFVTAKQGALRALNETLQSLCDSGYLMEFDKNKAAENYGYQGRCYRVVTLP